MFEYYFLAFTASFVYVALKSAQQMNVIYLHYWWVLPVSVGMSLCEAWVIFATAKNGFGWLAVVIGVGSGLGAMTSMYLHSLIKERE